MSRVIISTFLFLVQAGLAYPNQKIVVMAVRSRNIPMGPYRAALAGFASYLDTREIEPQVVEHDFGHEGQDGVVRLLSEIQSKKPELVFTLGTPATKAAQSSIKDIPVVFTIVLNPKRSEISASGVSMDIPYEAILENVKTILPGRTRIGVVYSPHSSRLYEKLMQASRKLGFKLIAKRINSEREFPRAVEGLSQQMDCFLMVPDPKIYFPKSVEFLLHESLRKKFPTIGLSSTYTRAGALVSFDCDYKDLGEQAAELALELLAEEEPVERKILRPRKVKFSLNLLVAKRIRVDIPAEKIKEASKVFGK